MNNLTGLTLTLACLLSTVSMAQQPQDPAGQKAAMRKLEWLVGNWEGSGWIQMGQSRREFTQKETIQMKLNGLVCLIEGEGKSKANDAIVHEALALVSYDEQAQTYRWRAFTAEGRQTDAEAKAGEKSLEWGFEIPQRGRIRYTLKLQDNGEWFETGEMSPDGQNWFKFFEMTLRRTR